VPRDEVRPDYDLPPPREVFFTVVDAKGDPLAGAEILVRSGSWHDGAVDGVVTQQLALHSRVAVTDAEGKASAKLPHAGAAHAWPAHLFVARAKGFAESVSGRRGNDAYEDDQRVDRIAHDTVRFHLERTEARTGRIQGLPPAKAPWAAVLRVTAKLRSGPNGFLHDSRSYAVPLADDGAYAIDHVPTDVHGCQWLVHSGRTTPPLLFDWAPGDRPLAPPELGSISRLSIAVLDASAGPASGRAVYLVRKTAGGRPGEMRVRTVVDAAGRAVVDLSPGVWSVHCLDVGGMATAEVDATTRSEPSVELRLQPFATKRGTVVDADGKPVAGARFVVRATSGTAEDPTLREWSVRGVRRLVAECRSAEDGSFAVPLPLFEKHQLVLCAQLGARSSEDFEPGLHRQEPLRVVLK
jgi:hypothetical protein